MDQLRRLLKYSLQSAVTIMLSTLTVGYLHGQTDPTPSQPEGATAKSPTYEVVSIRLSKGDQNSVGYGDTPDGFFLKGLTLEVLVPDAYGVSRNEQVTGWPGWAHSTRFNIEAKMDAETADALHNLSKQQQEVQRRLMIQSLLADRFNLKVHRETAVRPAFELVLAKGGSKMKQANPDTDSNGVKFQKGVPPAVDWRMSDGNITGHAMPLYILVSQAQGTVDAIVVDKTGLAGRYDVTLKWDPKNGQDPNSTQPSIFAALQEQLGLQLKPIKIPVDTIVIDHLGMPTEN
jgi:uncharacterized protein (TIGR03435 family)